MAKGFAKLSSLVATAALLVVSLASCSQRARKVDVLPEPSRGGDQSPSLPAPSGEWADLYAEVPAADLEQYVDLNASLQWRLEYLSTQDTGDIRLTNGRAEIVVTNLPVGQTGDLLLSIYENNELKLEGRQASLTLRAGRQPLELRLTPVDSANNGGAGGGDAAELVLQISIDGAPPATGGQTPPAGGQTPPAGGQGTPIAWGEISNIVRDLCSRCHSQRATEAYWTANKAAVKADLESGAMPTQGSPELGRMTADDKAKMLQFVSQ